MSTHKYMDRICVVAVVLSFLLTVVCMNGEALGIQPASRTMGYEEKLFDTNLVHTIDIVMDDWDSFIENCESEELFFSSPHQHDKKPSLRNICFLLYPLFR